MTCTFCNGGLPGDAKHWTILFNNFMVWREAGQENIDANEPCRTSAPVQLRAPWEKRTREGNGGRDALAPPGFLLVFKVGAGCHWKKHLSNREHINNIFRFQIMPLCVIWHPSVFRQRRQSVSSAELFRDSPHQPPCYWTSRGALRFPMLFPSSRRGLARKPHASAPRERSVGCRFHDVDCHRA